MSAQRIAATLVCLGLTAGAGMGLSTPAQALAACGEREPILEALAQKYAEHRRAYGVMGQAGLVELFVSKSGTWTVIISSPGGRACIVAAGHSWEQLPITEHLTGT
jgi:hypothetical protein